MEHEISKLVNLVSYGFYKFLRGNYLYYGLKRAVEESDEAKILSFLDKGAIANDLSILKIAVSNKNRIITEILLDNGGKADISPPIADRYDGNAHAFSEIHRTYPLLEIAIANEDSEIIKLLLEHGINPYEGLKQALESNNIEIVTLLINRSSNQDNNLVILKKFFSLKKNSIEKFYSDLNFNEHEELDDLLLSTAISNKNLNAIRLIIENHTPTNTCLFCSIKISKSGIFCILLKDLDHDLNLILNSEMRTLLHEISINGSKEQAICLLNKKSLIPFNINALDMYMKTAIYYALKNKNFSVYKLLQGLGATEQPSLS